MKRLTNRVVSGSCLCQYMKQRGIVGKGSHIQGYQPLFTHSVHPFLPVPLPVPLFFLSFLPYASASSTAAVVSGQKALYSQCILIFHCLPQGLVLMGSRRKGAGPREGRQVEERDRERERGLRRIERFISRSKEKGALKRRMISDTNQIINQRCLDWCFIQEPPETRKVCELLLLLYEAAAGAALYNRGCLRVISFSESIFSQCNVMPCVVDVREFLNKIKEDWKILMLNFKNSVFLFCFDFFLKQMLKL